ncbi:hypothetical protein MXL28_17325 [Klebsiella aerogenes]|uniref:hypothetical protein n=1 Tax=Klebsiella aerogenes TaxID=548 RepID=UPI002DB93DE2|nr:hypothetical protein [Klebsiella aerogenes]MEB6655053.1 hypothetical protein [Klebsiella aerogenes]
MNNEIEQIAQQNDMSIEFVRWFFNEKKADCGEQWFLALGAMWEGWKAREGEVTALALTLEKSREASGCPAGVDLQDWVKKLAEENLTMKDAIECHKAGFTVCEACGEENGSWNDDVCKALDEIAATDRIVAGIKASAIPEGFKLVPEQMYLSDEDIQAICMQCGNGDKKGYGDYEDGILWVGELSNDGEVKYGLNIANANYPEEGSITVFEFDEPLREGADK